MSEQTTPSTTRPRPVAAGQGALTTNVGPGFPQMEVKLAAADGLGFSVIEQHIPPRFSPPPVQHRQTREAAAVYVLEGELHYWFDDGEVIAATGTLVPLPRMVWWRWANQSELPCRVLAIFALQSHPPAARRTPPTPLPGYAPNMAMKSGAQTVPPGVESRTGRRSVSPGADEPGGLAAMLCRNSARQPGHSDSDHRSAAPGGVR